MAPRYAAFTGTDPIAFVISANILRRHLNESQRAMVAASLANMRQGERTDLQPSANLQKVSQSKAAELLNVSPRTVAHAAVVREAAIPAIADAVRQGRLPVSQAALVARLSEPAQQKVAADLANKGKGKSTSTIVLAATRTERVAEIERASVAQPLSALGRTFPVLYADPPWKFETWSAGGQLKAPDMHYPCMPTADIAALPVANIAAADSVLFMWALPAMLPEALEVIASWGFTFKTEAVWVKPRITCGHWLRGQHEPLLIATRGNMPPPPHLHSSVFEGDAAGNHSSKPDSVRDWIANAYPNTGRIELFARTAPPGWAAWGNQAPEAEAAA